MIPPPLAYSKIPIEDRKKLSQQFEHKYGEVGGYGGKYINYISVEGHRL